ncbi:MAG: ABC transporter permease [Fusobacteriaceae bacterium]|jgi:putative ABC transport system permease protein|nr:ABC transporter permease [Fusobacteriaceae bacterium]MBP6467735.1 ABC transporter permease [Fusobacteriaceae bacterium]MBP9596005.1 ABC transporter permease [Fusobacteriaceae bacterium]MBU9917615.1 ABC transporter permease [Fusobacteriaceae bacterium]
MGFWLSSLEQGLIFGIMVLGVYISYKILDFPDMTVDGAFPMGAAIVGSGLMAGVNPVICLILATIGGALAGLVTGILHVKFKIRDLLAGILVMTALYSINLRIMGKSNIHLFNVKHLFTYNLEPIVIILIILVVVKLILDFLLKTEFGFALRALGDNEKLIISLGINEKKLKIIGLMIANSMVALAGGVLAQHQGFADIGMGTGTIVAGLASIILGEGIFKNFKKMRMTTVVLVGSILYRFVIAIALKLGLRATDLKLVTALIVVIILIPKVNFWLNRKSKAGEVSVKN